MIRSTLHLYRSCALAAIASLRRSGLAVGFLLAASAALGFLLRLLGPFGLIGGIAAGFVEAIFVGWYLSLVRIAVTHRRTVTARDLRDQAGALYGDVLAVLFVWMLFGFVPLGGSGRTMGLVLLAANLALNPIPEVIWSGRDRGFQVFGTAWQFVLANAPEWFAPHAVVTLAVAALSAAMGAHFGPELALESSGPFGPSFGFFSLPAQLVLAFPLPIGLLAAVGAVTAVHGILLFRGHLFLGLGQGNRRQRAWRMRTGG